MQHFRDLALHLRIEWDVVIGGAVLRALHLVKPRQVLLDLPLLEQAHLVGPVVDLLVLDGVHCHLVHRPNDELGGFGHERFRVDGKLLQPSTAFQEFDQRASR